MWVVISIYIIYSAVVVYSVSRSEIHHWMEYVFLFFLWPVIFIMAINENNIRLDPVDIRLFPKSKIDISIDDRKITLDKEEENKVRYLLTSLEGKRR